MQNYLYKNKKKLISLLITGFVLSLFIKWAFNTGWKNFLSDTIFCISMVFLLYGLWEIVLNLGFFNGLVYGAKCLKDLWKSKLKSSVYLKDDYIDFVRSRKKRYDYKLLILLGIALLFISVLISIVL